MEKLKYPIKIGNIFKLSFAEEVGNTITHGIMSLLLLALLPIASVKGYIDGGYLLSFANSVYIIGVFFMFLMSTLYHTMLFDSKHKKIFRILDHCGIYVAIAATFTPVCVKNLSGYSLWIMLLIQWGSVIFGVVYKSLTANKKTKSGVLIYLAMGWSAVVLIPRLIATQSLLFLLLIVLGGLFYTIGIIFYTKKSKAWFHFTWHLFVNVASICHLIAILLFIQ